MTGGREELVEEAPSVRELVMRYLTDDFARSVEALKEPVSVRLFPGTLAGLADISEILDVPRSQLMREFIEAGVAEALDELRFVSKEKKA